MSRWTVGWLSALLGISSCSDGSVTCAADQVPCGGVCQSAASPCAEPALVLSALSPSVGELRPEFSGSQTTYTLSAPSWLQRMAFTPTLQSPGANIRVGAFETPSGHESIPIEIQPGTTQIPIVVSADSGAALRYLVDVQVSQPPQHYLKPSLNGASYRFGRAVAIDGDTLVVGAPLESSVWFERGAAFVYRFDGHTYREEAQLFPEATRASWFAQSVAVQGDLLAVGLPWLGGIGVVEIYQRTGTTWQHQATLRPPVSFGRDYFGTNLALSGDTLAVAMPNNPGGAYGVNGDVGNTDLPRSGAVYVFRRRGDTWQHEAFIKAINPDIDDQFGHSLALSGDDLVVGAPNESSSARGINGNGLDNTSPKSGAAYVYSRVGENWTVRAYLKASNADPSDRFGCAVAVGGNTLAVGACGEASGAHGVDGDLGDNSESEAGAVYVFQRSGSWSQQAYLKSAHGGPGDLFGYSLSVSADGQVLAAGAVMDAGLGVGINVVPYDRSAWYSGAASVFRLRRGRWIQEAYLKAPNAGVGDRFGETLALSRDGRSLLIGAIGEASQANTVDGDGSDNSAFGSGAAYVYR